MSKKLFISKRSIVFFCMLCLCATAAQFRSSIFHYGLRQYISYKIPMKGNWNFNYSSLSVTKDGAVLHDALIASEELGLTCTIGKLLCNPLSENNMHFSNYFTMEDVNLDFSKQITLTKPNQEIKIGKVLKLLQQIEIKNGTISIPDKSISFCVEKSISKNKIGKIVFDSNGKGQLGFDFASFADSFVVDVDAKVALLSFYKKFTQFFLGEKSTSWKIENGQLDGRAFFAISDKNQIKDARIHMNLLNLSCANDEIGVMASSKRVFLDVNFPTSMHPASFIENIKVSSSLEKATILIVDQNGENRASFKDLSGYFTLDSLKKAEVEISGHIDDEGRKIPVSFSGKPKESAGKGLDIDVVFQIDPLFGNEAKVNFSCFEEKEQLVLKTHIDSLEVKQILILQQCLALFKKEYKDYTIHSGTYSGDMSLCLDKDGIQALRFFNVLGKNVSIYSKKNDIHFDAKNISGELDLELFYEKTIEVTDWKCNIEKGNCVYGRKENLPLVIENIEGTTICRNLEMIDSKIFSEINGAKIEVEIKGDIDAPVFDVKINGDGNSLLTYFDQEGELSAYLFESSAKIEKKGGQYCAIYNCDLAFKDKKATIDGSALLDKQMNLEATFNSKKLTTEFMYLLQKLGKFSWSLEGDYGVCGTYKDSLLHMDVSAKNAKFIKEHSYIKEADGKGYFSYDFIKNIWQLNAHLTKGRKKLYLGKDLVLSNADIVYSSSEKYFAAKDIMAQILGLNIDRDLFLQIDCLNFYENGNNDFDVTLIDEKMELFRLDGKIENNRLTLLDSSHLLDKAIDLKTFSIEDMITLDADISLSLEESFFPKWLKKRELGDLLLNLTYKDGVLIAKGDLCEKAFKVKKDGEKISLQLNQNFLEGTIKDGEAFFDKAKFIFEKKHIAIDSLKVSNDCIDFSGKITEKEKGKENFFKGDIHVGLFDNFFIEALGTLDYHHDDGNGFFVSVIDPVKILYKDKIELHGGTYHIYKGDSFYGEFFPKSIIVHDIAEKISFHGVIAKMNKERIKDILSLDIESDVVQAYVEADLLPLEKDFWISASIEKEKLKYHDKELSLENISLCGNKKSLIVTAKAAVFESVIDLSLKLYNEKNPIFHIEGYKNNKEVLLFDGKINDGLEIYRLKGDILGCKFDVIPSDKAVKNVFYTDLQFNFAKLRRVLPEGAVAFIDKLALGSGISCLGELDLSSNTHFDGIIKGNDFDVGKYCLKSLYGKVLVNNGHVLIEDFSIADAALIVSSKKLSLTFEDEKCILETDKFAVEDFRPCLFSEKGKRARLTNPFVIKSLEFLNIKGDVTNLDTLTGKGSVKFLNAFEKKQNPVSLIAKEIIGRIGLDPVLMIPIAGEVDFLIHSGKINLTKMYNSYSDAKRSFFYLWHKTSSYLDFDGNISLDIRMKQYVLFKFAELFIISIDGPMTSPKVSLK